MNKKTIFIVISQGVPARNILRTEALKILQKQENLKIVIFLPSDPPDYWKEEFNFPNIIFEKLEDKPFGLFRRKIFDPLLRSLLHTESAFINLKFGTRKRVASPQYMIFWLLWSRLFGDSKLMKKLFRYLEMHLYPDRYYIDTFNKYNPNLVFSTSILAKVEIPMLKEAKRRDIKTVAMPKSWDTFDKQFFRVKIDKLLVYNEGLKEMAVHGQNIERENITVVGFPQFDIYSDKSILKPREEFLKSLGLDPKRKVVFFGSGGLFGPSFLDEEFATEISRFLNSNGVFEDTSLIIRLHFGEYNSKRFDKFKSLPNVYIDNTHQRNAIFGELGDPSREDMVWLANLLYHSNVTINPGSTLSLDAACYGKPIICTGFGCKTLENCINIAYYKRVLDTGGVRLVKNYNELKQSINEYLRDPSVDAKERAVLRKTVCANPDGKSGCRVAQFLLKEMGYKNSCCK
ncbi:MAG: CDP-glycerol glycerophosphotransferase family protein [Parcubacteria group bacterium]|nr:CDP-glycerol glycerophosphotransferase family protein [Parcubacteria group bacterium]